MSAIKNNVKFPDPQWDLGSELREIDDMPNYSTKAEAGVAILEEVCETLLDSPKMRDPNKLLDIARPITTKRTQLRPSLPTEIDSHLSTQRSLVMGLKSFAGSMLLHVINVWFYRKYKQHNIETSLWSGVFCQKKQRSAVDLAQANELELVEVDNAPHEYSQLARTIYVSQKTLNKIATAAATETIKRTTSHDSAPQQADLSFKFGKLMCLNTTSHMVTLDTNTCCVLKVFFQTLEKGPLLLNSKRINFSDSILSPIDFIFIHFNCGAKDFKKHKPNSL